MGVCPEVAGGFAVPRPPAEITTASGGAKVLQCVTAALLQQHGLKVLSEHQLDDAQAFLNTLDNQQPALAAGRL